MTTRMIEKDGTIVVIAADDHKSELDRPMLFEDALDQTGFGRYTYTLFFLSILLLLAMALDIFGTSFVVTASQCDLQLTTASKGLLGALPMLGIILSAHMWGYIADTRGRRRTLILSMGGTWICSWLGSLAPHWIVFGVFKFWSAFFASATNAVIYALLGECTPRAQRNKLVLLISSGLMFAQGVLAMIAYPSLHTHFSYDILGIRYRPWRLLCQIYGLASAFGLIAVVFFLHESPKFYISRGMEEQSLKVLRAIFAANTGKKPEEYPVKSLLFMESTNTNNKAGVLRSMWLQTAPLFQGALLKNTLIITYIVIVVYSIPPSFMMWMPTIANAYSRSISQNNTEGLNFCKLLTSQMNRNTSNVQEHVCNDRIENITYLCIFVFSSVLCVLNTANSFLIRYVSKKNVVIGFHILAGLCGMILNSVYSLSWSIFIFFGFQVNLVTMGLATSFTVEVYPTYLRAMAVCLTMMVGRGASFVCINFIGVLMERHCESSFYGFGAFLLSGALVALLLPSEQKKVTQEATITEKPVPGPE